MGSKLKFLTFCFGIGCIFLQISSPHLKGLTVLGGICEVWPIYILKSPFQLHPSLPRIRWYFRVMSWWNESWVMKCHLEKVKRCWFLQNVSQNFYRSCTSNNKRKTSQELGMLFRSLFECQLLTLKVMIQVSQFVRNSQLCH